MTIYPPLLAYVLLERSMEWVVDATKSTTLWYDTTTLVVIFVPRAG